MGSALETSRLAPLRGRSGNTAPRHAKLALRPICHASLRFYRSCAMGSALGRHASHACATGRLSRFTPARGRSITTPSQHVRPALRADRPRFAALLSSCAQGSALLISSVSLCQRERSALFLTQLAAHLSPLRRSFVPPLQRRLPSGTPEFRLQNSILAAPPCREAGRGPRGNWFPLESRSRILCATVTAAAVTAISSHASHACAGGRHLLRLSMCVRRFAPNAHASLRICLPAHTARTLYVVTPRTPRGRVDNAACRDVG